MWARTVEISLTQGAVAFIDDEDYGLVSQYKWCLDIKRNLFYAMTKGYIDGKHKNIKMHQLIMGAKHGQIVDHINHDGLDNRRANLRFCTHAENCRNSYARKGYSKYKGVSFYKNTQKWSASIMLEGKSKYIGSFFLEEDAARAYDEVAKKYFGEFARLNF